MRFHTNDDLGPIIFAYIKEHGSSSVPEIALSINKKMSSVGHAVRRLSRRNLLKIEESPPSGDRGRPRLIVSMGDAENVPIETRPHEIRKKRLRTRRQQKTLDWMRGNQRKFGVFTVLAAQIAKN